MSGPTASADAEGWTASAYQKLFIASMTTAVAGLADPVRDAAYLDELAENRGGWFDNLTAPLGE